MWPLVLALFAAYSSASFCDGSGWSVDFVDEFNGNTLNTSSWSVKLGAGNSYCRSASCTAEDVYLEDGALVLRTRRSSTNSSAFTSGGVDTRSKHAWHHGPEPFRACIAAQLPGSETPSQSQGVWPAHWMMPDSGACDPDQGEMDILEMINGDGLAQSTYHWQSDYPAANCTYPKDHQQVTASRGLPVGWNSTFHEYAVERGPSHVAFAVDGRVILNQSSSGGKLLLWDEPWFLILNSALGGPWPGEPSADTVLPVYHRIDYVRVVRRTQEGR